jgi:amino acid transporter
MPQHTYHYRLIPLLATFLALLLSPATLLAAQGKPIKLLECLPGMTPPNCEITFPAGSHPLYSLNAYMNPIFPWALAVAAGLTVLMIILGGFQIMLSGGGEKQREGKDRIIAALIGLLILLFSAAILAVLNEHYYRPGGFPGP